MGNINTLLTERMKKGDQSSKMSAMAKQSANGGRTGFSGIFGISELSEGEKIILEEILKEHSSEEKDFSKDLHSLISITSEVKAINNQAAILHGERIKKAQEILIRYRDGAFTTWLIKIYGNRQTPYNFLQYYEFYETLPKPLRPQIELMPRQAVYTLASREGDLQVKQQVVQEYKGETKSELLTKIRELFPLDSMDKRRANFGEATIQGLTRLTNSLQTHKAKLTKNQKKILLALAQQLQELISSCKDPA